MSRDESRAVWLLALGQMLIYAGIYYAFPALLPDLEAATGWSKGDLALGPTLSFLMMATMAPLTGRFIDQGHAAVMLVALPVVAVQGAGFGLMSIMRPMLVAEVLGRRGFGSISGAAAVSSILASAAAPSIGAFLLDHVGAGAIFASLILFSALSLAMAMVLIRSRSLEA